MLRQRLRTHSSPLARAGQLLVAVLALALVWYGLMLALLALKVSPASVNALSGYRDAYDALVGIEPADITSTARIITAVAGVLVFLVCGWLAIKQLPRPYLARGETELTADDRGTVTMEPRAIERVAEVAAVGRAGIAGATGLFGGDEITVHVTASRARDIAEDLRGVQSDVRDALRRHDLPAVPVHVMLTGFERRTRRELD